MVKNGQINHRRKQGSNGRRRMATTAARAPNAIVSRQLHRLATVNLSTTNPNGGTEHFFQLGARLDDYDAHTQLIEQYEQYKITNLRIMIRPNAQNAAGIADPINKIGAAFALKNFTSIECFIDYDTETAPNQAEIIRRDKVKLTLLNRDGWQEIASFTPKVRFNTAANSLPAMVTSTDWLSTDFPDLAHAGLRGVFKHDSDFWGTTASSAAKVSLYYTATVHFRGLKSGV